MTILCRAVPVCVASPLRRLRHPEQLERLDELGGEYRLRLGGPVHRGTHVLDLGPNDLEPRGHLLEVHSSFAERAMESIRCA